MSTWGNYNEENRRPNISHIPRKKIAFALSHNTSHTYTETPEGPAFLPQGTIDFVVHFIEQALLIYSLKHSGNFDCFQWNETVNIVEVGFMLKPFIDRYTIELKYDIYKCIFLNSLPIDRYNKNMYMRSPTLTHWIRIQIVR